MLRRFEANASPTSRHGTRVPAALSPNYLAADMLPIYTILHLVSRAHFQGYTWWLRRKWGSSGCNGSTSGLSKGFELAKPACGRPGEHRHHSDTARETRGGLGDGGVLDTGSSTPQSPGPQQGALPYIDSNEMDTPRWSLLCSNTADSNPPTASQSEDGNFGLELNYDLAFLKGSFDEDGMFDWLSWDSRAQA